MKKGILLSGAMLAFVYLAIAQNNGTTNPRIEKSGPATIEWSVVPSGVGEDLLSVHFANASKGFIGGSNARCLKSTDEGNNWNPVPVHSYANFKAVWATSDNDVYLGAWDTIYASHNGGQNWTGAYTGTENYEIYELQFTSPDKGFGFMTWSQFVKTTDGGNSWPLAAGGGFTALDFFDGYMLDENTGWGVGDLSMLAKTTDGGESFVPYEWNGYLDYTGIQLWGVFATTASDAWAVADSGVVFHTTDGGNYWVRSTIAGPEDRLTDIYFVNANTGYIVGYNGLIFKTTDGGDNWFQEPLLTVNNLNAVFFISENLGWVVGNNGTILRYGEDNIGIPDLSQSPDNNLAISPNPVSAHSSITFTLPGSMKVQIEIRDISGRVIKRVYEGTLSCGEHNIRMDVPELSNGVYFCQLSVQEKNICRPFVVIH